MRWDHLLDLLTLNGLTLDQQVVEKLYYSAVTTSFQFVNTVFMIDCYLLLAGYTTACVNNDVLEWVEVDVAKLMDETLTKVTNKQFNDKLNNLTL